MTNNHTRKFGWLTVAIIAIDWLSKFLILNSVALWQQVTVLDGWLYLMRTQNKGIAFGILNQSGHAWRAPILAACVVIVLWMLSRIAGAVTDTCARFGIALIAGGAIGNLGDRIANGGVTDFIAVRTFPWIFNIADTAVVTGAVLLALGLAFPKHDAIETR